MQKSRKIADNIFLSVSNAMPEVAVKSAQSSEIFFVQKFDSTLIFANKSNKKLNR